MIKLSSLKGMSILSLQEGEQLGQVRDTIVDPSARQVVALVLDRRASTGEPQVVATANIHNVGEAAITIEDRGRLVPLSRIPRFKELARARKPIYGRQVLSESGTRVGHIADLELELPSFRIAGFQLKGPLFRSGRSLPADQVRTIGMDAVIVRDEPAVESKPARPVPAPLPSAALAPAEIPTVPPLPSPEFCPPAFGLEPAQEVEPAVPPVSSPGEPAAHVLAERPAVEPTLPSLATEPPAPPEDVQSAELPAICGEPGPEPVPPEVASEEGPPSATENPWQRWVHRLRRRDGDK